MKAHLTSTPSISVFPRAPLGRSVFNSARVGARPGLNMISKSNSCSRVERRMVTIRAEAGRKTSFTAGVVIGGVVFGVLGFLYAPQISEALLDEQRRLKVLQYLPGHVSKPVTREDVMSRLDELHTVLDNLSKDMGISSSVQNEEIDKTETAKNNGEATDNQSTSPLNKPTTSSSET